MGEEKGLNPQGGETSEQETGANAAAGTSKAFTQADIDAAVKAAVEKANAGIEERIKNAKTEAEKLAKMDEQERIAEERRIEQENFAKEKAAFAAEKLRMFAERKLNAVGLPSSLAATVAGGDEESTEANINALAESFKTAVADGVKEKLAGKAPHGGTQNTVQSEKDKMQEDIAKAMKRGF